MAQSVADELMEHVQAIAGPGPRPAGSAAEAAAHGYAARRLQEWGARVQVEHFAVWRTLSQPWLLVAGLLFLAALLLWWLPDRPGVALAVAALGGVCFWGMHSGRLELGRLFAAHQSRNVIGVMPPAGPVRQRVVLVAHADTQRATFFWHPAQVRSFALSQKLNVLLAGWLLLMVVGATLAPGTAVWRWLSLPSLVGLAWGALLLIHRELFLPWVQGANDNASGMAVVLALAKRLQDRPLQHTELWCVMTGAEEVGAPVGANRFFDRYGAELRDAWVMVPDNLGAGDLRCLTGEGNFFRSYKADSHLLSLAAELAARHPEWRIATARAPIGQYTDAQPAMMRRIRTMAMWGERDGLIPNYHWPTDTVVRVEPDALERAYQFLAELIQTLDQMAVEPRRRA